VLPEGNGSVASTRHALFSPRHALSSTRHALSEVEIKGRIAEATADVRTTAAIEAQYVMDPRLSALAIDVNTRAGVVTLAGHVDNAADAAHAIDLAMRHRNVREVISTLAVVQPVADAPPSETQ
jgi:osmotically-inducible protein OsmY